MDVLEGFADGVDFVGVRVIEADDGRGFGEAVALVDAHAGVGKPAYGIHAEGRGAGDEVLDAATEGLCDFREDELVGELPGEAGGEFALNDFITMLFTGGDGPVEDGVLDG